MKIMFSSNYWSSRMVWHDLNSYLGCRDDADTEYMAFVGKMWRKDENAFSSFLRLLAMKFYGCVGSAWMSVWMNFEVKWKWEKASCNEFWVRGFETRFHVFWEVFDFFVVDLIRGECYVWHEGTLARFWVSLEQVWMEMHFHDENAFS